MAAPKVLVGSDDRGAAAPRMQPAPETAWRLVVWVGLLFTAVGAADLALVWYPPSFGSPEWEFGSVTAAMNGMPVPTMGLVLVLAGAVATGRRWLARTVSVVLLVAAIVMVAAAVMYATNVPIALRSLADNAVTQSGLKKAIAKTVVQLLCYPAVFAYLGVRGWEGSRSRAT